MFHLKIVIPFCVLFLSLNTILSAQKVDLTTEKNKAKVYAILSAQYSTDAYYYSRQNFFISSTEQIKQNCDTGVVFAQMAVVYADSAIMMGHDTCLYGKSVMLTAKKYQEKAIIEFQKIRESDNSYEIHELSGESMYNMGNAVAEAYKASLFMESKAEESDRDIIRLESDEYAYETVKEVYLKRFEAVSYELELLEISTDNSGGVSLDEINSAIRALNQEKEMLAEKIRKSDNKLISVKNELSDEMLKIVNKDIFTTEKKGFYDKHVPIPDNHEVPGGLIYKVQLGFLSSQLPTDHFKGVFPISSEIVDEVYYRYVAGNFATYEEAKSAKIALLAKGYEDSFVVAYFNHKSIGISEALKKETELQ